MRLKGVNETNATLGVRALFYWLRRRGGRIPGPLRIYAYRPAILWRFLGLGRVIRRPGRLPPRLKGLAMYWTARNVDCRF